MKRRRFTSQFKTKVVLETLKKSVTIQELGRKYEIHPAQISNWKAQFTQHLTSIAEKDDKENLAREVWA